MPLYEYFCQDKECGHVTELLRPMREMDDATLCEKCKKDARRGVSVSSFTLKGGGWASDGYSGGGS